MNVTGDAKSGHGGERDAVNSKYDLGIIPELGDVRLLRPKAEGM